MLEWSLRHIVVHFSERFLFKQDSRNCKHVKLSLEGVELVESFGFFEGRAAVFVCLQFHIGLFFTVARVFLFEKINITAWMRKKSDNLR